METCFNCDQKATNVFKSEYFCDTCREEICFLCSERNGTLARKSTCPPHIINAPFKGNRFMEDKAFMAGGPFEFEPA